MSGKKFFWVKTSVALFLSFENCRKHCEGSRISLIAQGIGMRKRLVRSEGSGKMERMLLAGGFCDLAGKYMYNKLLQTISLLFRSLCLH